MSHAIPACRGPFQTHQRLTLRPGSAFHSFAASSEEIQLVLMDAEPRRQAPTGPAEQNWNTCKRGKYPDEYLSSGSLDQLRGGSSVLKCGT